MNPNYCVLNYLKGICFKINKNIFDFYGSDIGCIFHLRWNC